jgi:osmotically inducible protein OsmC
MNTIDTVLYTGKTRTVGGREGHARSDDGNLDIKLSPPGSGGDGTNPEQLFAAGWSACFEGAIRKAGRKLKITVPPGVAIDAEVDLGMVGDAFQLQARLSVSLPGVELESARALVDEAHRTCPYSKATHGNIDVQIRIA